MKLVPLILLLAAAGTALQTPAPGGRRDWIDPATGHRVIRISDDPGSSTLYFHDKKWVVFTGQFAPGPSTSSGAARAQSAAGDRHVYAVEIARQQ